MKSDSVQLATSATWLLNRRDPMLKSSTSDGLTQPNKALEAGL